MVQKVCWKIPGNGGKSLSEIYKNPHVEGLTLCLGQLRRPGKICSSRDDGFFFQEVTESNLELLMEELERLKAFSFNHELLLQVQGSFANKVFLSRIRYHRYWYTILPDQITPVSSVRKLLDQG